MTTARPVQICSYFQSLPAVCLLQDTYRQSIPDILGAASEWQICLDTAAKNGLMTSSHLLSCSVVQATKASCTSEGPAVASVNVEHSFSKHGSVTDQ